MQVDPEEICRSAAARQACVQVTTVTHLGALFGQAFEFFDRGSRPERFRDRRHELGVERHQLLKMFAIRDEGENSIPDVPDIDDLLQQFLSPGRKLAA